MASDAAIGEHIADQLLLPLAFAGGRFTTNVVSEHFKTNSTIIEQFLPVKFNTEKRNAHCYLVEVKNEGA